MSVMNRIAAAAGVCLSMFANLSAAQVQPLNASFESPAVASGTRTASPAGSNWTFAGTAGIERFAPTFAYYGGGFTGEQVAYISATGNAASRGSVAQNVNFPSAGYYVVRFAAGRTGKNNGIQVSVAGTIVEAGIVPRVLGSGSNPQFESWWTVPFYVSGAGLAEIKFAGTQAVKIADGDAVWIDQVTVSSVPVAIDNSSFENPSSAWTFAATAIVAGTQNGRVGSQVLQLGFSGSGGWAQSPPATFAAGKYSLSARVAKVGGGNACTIRIYTVVNGAATEVAVLPPATSFDFVPYTSAGFDLPAGTYSLRLLDVCAGGANTLLDSLVLNSVLAEFADPNFTSPDIGYPIDVYDTPKVYQPSGSAWTYVGPGAIQANPGSGVYSAPVTPWGHQYGFLDGTFAKISQSVTLSSGTYVLVLQASSGLFQVTVNGQNEVSISRGYSLANGSSTNPGLDFGEVVTAPFTIGGSGPVTIGVRGAGGWSGVQSLRIVRVSAPNAPPVVTITAPAVAPGKSYALLQGPGPVSTTVSATATDSDGLQANSLYLTSNGTQIGTAASASPYSATLGGLTAGSYTLRAFATDTQGLAAAPAVLTLKVNNPPQGGFTLAPSGTVHTPPATAVAVAVSPLPTDSDGTVVLSEVLLDGAVQTNCTRASSPWSCTLSLAPRSTVYSVVVRFTDDDGAITTTAPSLVSINAKPSVTLTTPANGANFAPPAAIVLTATASDSDGSVTKVEFYNGASLIGTVNTGAGGQTGSTYTYTWTAVPIGSYSLTAVATDNRGGTTTSSVNAVTVSTATSTTLVASPSPVNFGDVVTLTATVSPNAASGTVDFKEGTTPLCSAVALSGTTTRTATCTLQQPTPSAGSHSYTANYSGTAGYAVSSGSTSLVVNKLVSTAALSASPGGTSTYGNPITLTATISPAAATGTVNFSDGATTLCSNVALTGTTTKSASCVLSVAQNTPASALAAGSHSYSATYSGDTAYQQSGATPIAYVINKASSTVTASYAPSVPVGGQTLTLTATVGPAAVTGQVEFKEGTNVLCGVPQALVGTTTKTASCSFGSGTLALGSHSYTLNYLGDNNFNSSSTLLSVNVAANSPPVIAIQSASVVAGQATVTVTSADAQGTPLNISGTLADLAGSTVATLVYSNGTLTGPAPTAAGIYTVTVAATDGAATTTARSTVAVQETPGAENVDAGSSTATSFGTIGGSYSTTESGAATYNIPILTPPGINGVQPSLALSYSSQGSYGMLGVGWSLSGLGSITRCPRNVAQDGYRAAINYDNDWSNDAYCYGGQRLIPVSGRASTGATGTATLYYTDSQGQLQSQVSTEPIDRQEFRTEIDSFSRITGYYGSTNLPHGVSRFEVETRDGRVLHFSRRWKPTSNGFETCPNPNDLSRCYRQQAGQLVKFYVLDRVEDRAGNLMEIDYSGSNVEDWTTALGRGAAPSYPPTEAYPTQIRYTSNPAAGVSASTRIDFSYATLPAAAQLRSFDAGAGESILTKQLSGIAIYDASVLKKRYTLTYVSGGSANSGRALLDNVRECYGPTSDTCLPPTQFSWQGGSFAGLGTVDKNWTLPVGTNPGDASFKDARIADIFGNGRSSFLWVQFYGSLNPSTQVGTILVCPLGATSSINCTPQYFQDTSFASTQRQFYFADVDGDGRADLVVQDRSNNNVKVCLANKDGTGFGATPGTKTTCLQTNFAGWDPVNVPLLQGDFNGDGRIDFAFIRSGQMNATDNGIIGLWLDVYFSDGGAGFTGPRTVLLPPSVGDVAAATWAVKDQLVVGDFNGDGLADIVQLTGPGTVRVCFSRQMPNPPYGWTLDCPQDNEVPMPGSTNRLPDPWAEFTCKITDGTMLAGQTTSFSLNGVFAAPGGPNFYVGVLSASDNPGDNCYAYDEYSVTSQQARASAGDGGKRTGTGTGCVDGTGSVFSPQLNLTVSRSNQYPESGTGNSFTVAVGNMGSTRFSGELTLKQRPPQRFTPTGLSIPGNMSCTKTEATSSVVTTNSYGTTQDLLLADMNGDGLADLLAPVDINSVGSTGQWNVCLSTGDGAFARYRTTGVAQSTCTTHALVKAKPENVVLGDFDGDGRTDVLAYGDTDAVAALGQNAWRVCFSRGTDATATTATQSMGFDCRNFVWNKPFFLPVRDHVKAGDFNGDGITDLAYAPNNTTIRVGVPTGVKQDLITRFTTGLGATTDVTYAPLTDSTVYSKGTQGQMPPGEVQIQSPMYVVKQVDADNGVDVVNWFSTKYFYEGLKGTTTGRGMLGFDKRTVDDLTGGFTSVTTYNNSLAQWQIAGRPVSVVKTHPNAGEPGRRLNQAESSYHIRERLVGSASKPVYDVLTNVSTASSWELVGGAALPVSTTTTLLADYDSYGNALRSTVSQSDGYTKVTENTYLNQVTSAQYGSLARGDWIIGRVRTAKATHQRTGAADVVRNSSFTYYGIDSQCAGGIKGFLCEEVLEPSLATDASEQFSNLTGYPKFLLWQSSRHSYDNVGNRTSTQVSFRDAGNVLRQRESGNTTFNQGGGRYAGTITNALGHAESRTYETAFGLVKSQIGPNGFLTQTDYDGFGRKIRERTFDGDSNTSHAVSDASWLYQHCNETDALYGTEALCQSGEIYRTRKRVSAGATTITFYDRLQRERRVRTQAFAPGTWAESTISYDTRGRKLSSTRPSGSGTAATSWQYDDLNRATTETLSGGGLSHATQFAFNGLSSTVTHVATNSEIAAGMNDQSQTRVVNSQGQVVSSTDALGNVTSFGYDAVGNLTQVIAPGGLTESMRFDGRGRKVELVSTTAGTHRYRFNGLGEMESQTDGRGWDTTMAYDALGRLTTRTEYKSSLAAAVEPFTTSWTYDAATPGSTCGQTGPNGTPATKGKLCEVSTTVNALASTRTRHIYDAVGRQVQSTVDLDRSAAPSAGGRDGPRSFVSTLLYDTQSRVVATGSPGGVVQRNVFQSWGGALTTVTDGAGAVAHWQASARYLDGQISSMSVGGINTVKAYDGLGRLDTIVAGGGAIQNVNVDFDIFGNLKARSDSASGLAFETFKYDALNRLTHTGTTATSFPTVLATYDEVGNITSKRGQGAYTYDAISKRLSGFNGNTYGYDNNGNVLTDGQRGIVYNTFNLPDTITRGANTLAYSYDHSHSRVKESSPTHGTTYYLGGYELVIPVDSTDVTPKREERTYINTPEGTVGVITQVSSGNATGAATQSTDTRYWHKDHLGSISAITNASGAVVQRFRFDPWGQRECLNLGTLVAMPCSSGSLANGGSEERGYTGHEMLDEVGLVHMNGRLFDPTLGRFLQADPIIQEPLNSQNYNRYSYVLNNPLAYTDPTGFSFWTKVRQPLGALAAMIAVPYLASEFMVAMEIGTDAFTAELMATGSSAMNALSTGAQLAANVAGGFAAGGITGGNMESAVLGAFQAMASFGIGEITYHGTTPGNIGQYIGNIAAHAALGCAMSSAAGGNCRSGALAGGFSAAAGPVIAGMTGGNFAAGLAARMAAGCVGSYIGKGSCEAGAVTAAFDYIYNAHGKGNWGGEDRGRAAIPLGDFSETTGFAKLWNDWLVGMIGPGGPSGRSGKAGVRAIEKELVDLTEHRAEHILNRHRAGAGKAGKTEFPAHWSDAQILHHVSDVATDPKALLGIGKWNSPFAIGVRDGVTIHVDFYPLSHPLYGGKISTAYPVVLP